MIPFDIIRKIAATLLGAETPGAVDRVRRVLHPRTSRPVTHRGW